MTAARAAAEELLDLINEWDAQGRDAIWATDLLLYAQTLVLPPVLAELPKETP